MSSHLGLDLDRVEDLFTFVSPCTNSILKQERATHLAVVDANNRADHFRDDNHVTQMGLYDGRLLVGLSLLLGFTQLLDETHGTALEATLKPSASTGVDEVDELSEVVNERDDMDCWMRL